ncbi:HAD family hydrolase [Miniimonas sp. S16]|uniref:HAD family hydrolase n=1 Tax=Miniimonas sp. S16 TaxID=2171623 RepID=UPI000D52716E|nr:HAD family hydrolase [Miniimonas sp. S16]
MTPTPDPADIRLVAVDLDGTLLDPHKRLDPDFPAVEHALAERGITLVPASGRQLESIRRTVWPDGAGGVDDSPTGEQRTIIAENGALVARGTQPIAVDPVPRHAVGHVLAAARDYARAGGHPGIVVCGLRSAYVALDAVHDDEAMAEQFLAASRPYYPLLEEVADLAAVEDDVLKVAVWDPAGAERGVGRSIGEVPGARVVASAGVWVDVMSPTADKGRALATLQAELGVSPDQTMAFGDFPNDLGMLARATWSYAMADAHPDVAAAARYRAPTNADRGVTRVLRALLGR